MLGNKWIQVKEATRWGNVYYVDKSLCPYAYGKTEGTDLKLKEGQLVRVQFPTGDTGIYSLESRISYSTAFGHGTQWRVEQSRYGIDVVVKGVICWVPIADVKIKLLLLRGATSE